MRKKSFFTKSEIFAAALTAVYFLTLYAQQPSAQISSPEKGYTVQIDHGTVERFTPAAAGQEAKINVNTAPAEELEELYGIGEVKAQAIVDWREEHGPFTCAEDLLAVPGIGTKTLEQIRDDITWEVTP